MQVFFLYVLPLEIQLSRGEGWDPSNLFNPTILLLRLKPEREFLTLFVVISELNWAVGVPFVDIGGIVGHHCLHFLLIMG